MSLVPDTNVFLAASHLVKSYSGTAVSLAQSSFSSMYVIFNYDVLDE
jgi:hypothetical protein